MESTISAKPDVLFCKLYSLSTINYLCLDVIIKMIKNNKTKISIKDISHQVLAEFWQLDLDNLEMDSDVKLLNEVRILLMTRFGLTDKETPFNIMQILNYSDDRIINAKLFASIKSSLKKISNPLRLLDIESANYWKKILENTWKCDVGFFEQNSNEIIIDKAWSKYIISNYDDLNNFIDLQIHGGFKAINNNVNDVADKNTIYEETLKEDNFKILDKLENRMRFQIPFNKSKLNFLIDDEKGQKEFKEIWSNLSVQLREIDLDYISVIEAKKKAENAMYNGVCRTERIAAIDKGDFINDESSKLPISVTEKDIMSYVEADKLLNNIGANNYVPVDYVKSSPYILSFMKDYKMKRQIERYFKNKRDKLKIARSNNLWINEGAIRNYREISSANGRLERLKEAAFENKAEMLLWIPPSLPYYKPLGPFKNAENFSKILVFSAWEMVPRMIATLISYEAERKTVGKIVEQKKLKINTSYFAPNNKRYPTARLRFNLDNNIPQSMSMFCLLYPSKTLANLYNPIECMNQGKSLNDIEKDLAGKINDLLRKFERYQGFGNREDERWYYLAPFLFDSQGYITTWFHYGADLVSGDADEEEKDRGQKGFLAHLMKLREYNDRLKNIHLGKMPRDLTDVLVNMAIASPAVCAYRSNGQDSLYATQISKLIINMFNRQESIAAVDLCYSKKNTDAYWKNVLNYCKDGNLQSVLDEFVHMIAESNGYSDSPYKSQLVHSEMMVSMKMHTSSYNVDTFNKFKDRALNKKNKGINMRSHYAVGFYKDEGDTGKSTNRRESIRSAFNSPFRPFVLATTSIGQEGLDFHYYCRKVMHWNLPSNPIDLEQREGRINRFKCHAIRQNIAIKYKDSIKFKKDIWVELFERAKEEYRDGYSDLIPYWCLPDDQEIKIERIIASYPLSKDIGNYQRLIKILSLYRLTLGQARQEELLEHIFTKCDDCEKLKDLFINLSPYYREKIKSAGLYE